jgi:ATP-dependent DNA ligase
MLLERASELPEGTEWLHELKLDGYRAIAFRSGERIHLRSRKRQRLQRSILCDFEGPERTSSRSIC